MTFWGMGNRNCLADQALENSPFLASQPANWPFVSGLLGRARSAVAEGKSKSKRIFSYRCAPNSYGAQARARAHESCALFGPMLLYRSLGKSASIVKSIVSGYEGVTERPHVPVAAWL